MHSPKNTIVDLIEHEDQTIFHRPDWLSLIEECYRLGPNHVSVSSNTGSGFLPLFFVNSPLFGRKLTSQPFNFYGGITASSDTATREILLKAKSLRNEKRARYVEIKNVCPLPKEIIDEFQLIERSPNVRYVVPLQTTSEEFDSKLKRRFREKLSGLYRRAKDEGLIISNAGAHDLASLKAFYNILTDEYRIKHFMLPQPFRLFRLASEILSERFHLYIAKLNDRMIGGAIVLRDNETDFYLWGAYNQQFDYLSPLTLILSDAMKAARNAGSKWFDLGVTSRSHEGLNFFKSRWGGICEPLHYYYIADKPEDVPHLDYFNSFRRARQLIRYVPRPIVQQTSELVIRWLA